jgi:hypothetical protein
LFKSFFSKNLDSLFEWFKDSNDSCRETLLGIHSIDSSIKVCKGFSFIGNHSKCPSAFRNDVDATQVNNIYILKKSDRKKPVDE